MPVIRIVGATEIRTPLVIVPFPSSALDMSTVEKSLPVLQRQILKRRLGATVEICYIRRNPFDTSHVAHLVAIGIVIFGPDERSLEERAGDDLADWMKLKLKGLFDKNEKRVTTRRKR
jgi:hypothetical protein